MVSGSVFAVLARWDPPMENVAVDVFAVLHRRFPTRLPCFTDAAADASGVPSEAAQASVG